MLDNQFCPEIGENIHTMTNISQRKTFLPEFDYSVLAKKKKLKNFQYT